MDRACIELFLSWPILMSGKKYVLNNGKTPKSSENNEIAWNVHQNELYFNVTTSLWCHIDCIRCIHFVLDIFLHCGFQKVEYSIK